MSKPRKDRARNMEWYNKPLATTWANIRVGKSPEEVAEEIKRLIASSPCSEMEAALLSFRLNATDAGETIDLVKEILQSMTKCDEEIRQNELNTTRIEEIIAGINGRIDDIDNTIQKLQEEKRGLRNKLNSLHQELEDYARFKAELFKKDAELRHFAEMIDKNVYVVVDAGITPAILCNHTYGFFITTTMEQKIFPALSRIAKVEYIESMAEELIPIKLRYTPEKDKQIFQRTEALCLLITDLYYGGASYVVKVSDDMMERIKPLNDRGIPFERIL